jgi:hypothetical protein
VKDPIVLIAALLVLVAGLWGGYAKRHEEPVKSMLEKIKGLYDSAQGLTKIVEEPIPPGYEPDPLNEGDVQPVVG